jgi:hypothetical protein
MQAISTTVAVFQCILLPVSIDESAQFFLPVQDHVCPSVPEGQ